ncbi:PREDICTED: HSP-interacting protein-like isoform X2 [Lupinus angustifolius]|uniref:HSP-interacting protein-like isoform X2 n=1 Tax=Lupinus angustifolius TaxID=3871 RepID=UPI00092EE43F|nr:PREDICTED: HSP-interacting protein-like isoform X2 [Lupinus angustifolius]
MGKKKKHVGETSEHNGNQSKVGDRSHEAYEKTSISISQELKGEGNKLFCKRDLEGALIKYEKALTLLPKNHVDVSNLRSSMAACYMQMGLSEYPRAIHECDLALKVTPNYSIALLKRARCFKDLNRIDLALRDVRTVVKMEPNNVTALDLYENVKNALEEKGLRVSDMTIELPLDYVEPPTTLPPQKVVKEKTRKKKTNKKEEKVLGNKIPKKQAEEKFEEKKAEDSIMKKTNIFKKKATKKVDEKKAEESIMKKTNKFKKKATEKIDEKKADIKEAVDEKSNGRRGNVPKKTAKLIFGEDIRWAELPVNCSLLQLREIICDRFPSLRAVLVKYRDQEGDLVTITSDEELKLAGAGNQGSFRLYLVEATPEQDPMFEKLKVNTGEEFRINNEPENGCMVKANEIITPSCIEDWVILFAKLFENNVGFESDRYLDFHELGMELSSEALEEVVTSKEAQGVFDMAGDKFQEMTALALFNWGNIHMSRARKKVYFKDDYSKEHPCEQFKSSYEWAQKEYAKAGEKYEMAIKIKSDFYEAFVALGQQQFEQAKHSSYYALSNDIDLATWPSHEVLRLYNNSDDNMKKGMLIWEELEKQCLGKTSYSKDVRLHLQSTGLDRMIKTISSDDIAAQATNIRSQINLLWGTMLYERSIAEFKFQLPVWHESLQVAIKKFERAGASPTDITVMLKNHCSNNTAVDGFKIDEILQAWNEMYEAKRWQSGIPSFRLDPLFKRRVPKVYNASEPA